MLEDDRFNMQGNLLMRLILGAQDEQTSRLAHQMLKVHVEALTGFSHIYCSDGLKTTSLSQGYDLGEASEGGKSSRIHIPKTVGEVSIL